MMKSTIGVGIAMTQGSFNLTRTGHVGVDRDGNTEAASKHLVRFLKSSYVSMMAENALSLPSSPLPSSSPCSSMRTHI